MYRVCSDYSRVQRFKKKFLGAKALDSIPCNVERGNVYALLGEKAAGNASGRGQRYSYRENSANVAIVCRQRGMNI